MPNFSYFVVLLLLCNTCFAQSPFMQANNTKSKPTVGLDTTTLHLTDKIDAILKIADNTRFNTNITDIKDILLNTLNEKEFQEIIEENDRIKNKVDIIQSELNKLVGKNNPDVQKKMNELASSNKELEESNKKVEDAGKEIERLKKRILTLTNENHALEIKKIKYNISDIKGSAINLSNALVKVEENNIKIQNWRENKLLKEDDEREVLELYTKMVLQNYEGKKSIKDLQSNIENIEKKLEKFEENKNQIDAVIKFDSNLALKDTLAKVSEEQDKLKNDINKMLDNFNETLKSSKEKLKTIESEINSHKQTITKIYKAYKTIEPPKEDNVKAISGITQPLSEYGQLVPNISLLGYREVKSENSNRSALLKLFIAPSTGKKSQFNNAYRLLIPEASNYGFLADFSFGFIPSNNSFTADKGTGQPVKKLGINLSTYYLGKELAKQDSSTFNSGMLHFKIGMQYVVIGKVLSIYSNINSFYLSNGVKDFKATYPTYENKLRSFVDFGLNAYLNLSPEAKLDDFFIDLDLGFIVVGGDIKSIVSTTDPLIPRIKVSLVKGFRF